jgi:hypothetical protein
METMYYISLDVHKKTIDYCVKDDSGCIYAAGSTVRTSPFYPQSLRPGKNGRFVASKPRGA